MYTLSRDKLVMDIDKSSLKLMIMILNMNIPKEKEIENNLLYKKLNQQCKSLLIKLEDKYNNENCCLNEIENGYSLKFDFDNLNANILVLECLLSLTNRRIGDWYKEELRVLGAFEHILNLVNKCVSDINLNINNNNNDKIFLNNLLIKYIRCFKLLENVTHANLENQNYICVYKNSFLISLIKKYVRYRTLGEKTVFIIKFFYSSLNIFFKKLVRDSINENIKKSISDAIKNTFLLMINLTHNNGKLSSFKKYDIFYLYFFYVLENGCKKIANDTELINLFFTCIHEFIVHICENEKFDVLIMVIFFLNFFLNL
jgi:hypothetical protein